MGSNIIELAKLGHERAAELKASCGAVDVRSVAQLISDLATQLEVQLVRGNALAAENAGLKSTCDDRRTFIMNGVQLGYIKVPTVETDPALETIRVAVSPQEPTPATDSFLAEVRASGADEVSAICRGLANKDGCSVNMQCSYNLTAERAEAVAAQLRKGAAL